MERTYRFTDTATGRKEVHRYGREDALEVFGQETVWQLDTGAVCDWKGQKVVDLEAFFDRTQG